MESVKMIAPETALKQQSSKRHGQQRQLNKLGGGHKAAGHEQGDSKQVKANVAEKSTPKSGGEQKVTVTRATRERMIPNRMQFGASKTLMRNAMLYPSLSASRLHSLRQYNQMVTSHHCQSHSFLADVTDVRQMENTLLQLLSDFHSGKLQAFGQDISFEKMEKVREQQEKLAKLHFELSAQQEVFGHQTEEERKLAKDKISQLIKNLQELSLSIEQLQSRTSATTNEH